jgi:hypothetical protein
VERDTAWEGSVDHGVLFDSRIVTKEALESKEKPETIEESELVCLGIPISGLPDFEQFYAFKSAASCCKRMIYNNLKFNN